jgi:hypothetical protein
MSDTPLHVRRSCFFTAACRTACERAVVAVLYISLLGHFVWRAGLIQVALWEYILAFGS